MPDQEMDGLEFAKLWIAALESGQYRQITGALAKVMTDDQQNPGFCCLGVACQVAAEHGHLAGVRGLRFPSLEDDEYPSEVREHDGGFMVVSSRDDETAGPRFWEGTLPEDVALLLGFTEPSGTFPADNYNPDPMINGNCLTDWNDTEKATFLEIATMLREHYGLPPREEVATDG